MAQFQAFDQRVLVSGQSMMAVIEAMELFEKLARSIFQAHGLANIRVDQWYPQQPYLDAYREIYEKIGAKTVKTIGRKVPEKAFWPPNITTVEEALASIDTAYHMNHRGGEIGSYQFKSTGMRSAVMVCHNPYPCSFDMSVIEGTAMKFAPKNARLVIQHDNKQPCRMNGGETCAYQISW